ncbi:hypothetical protein [Streptacidiphilus sp. PAMC 29251]
MNAPKPVPPAGVVRRRVRVRPALPLPLTDSAKVLAVVSASGHGLTAGVVAARTGLAPGRALVVLQALVTRGLLVDLGGYSGYAIPRTEAA